MDAIVDGGRPRTAEAVSTSSTSAICRELQSAAGRFPNAVGARDAAFAFFGLTVVPPGHDVEDYRDSGRELMDALRPWLHDRAHPSFLGPADATEAGTRRAYDPEVYRDLQAVKAKYDPRNVFRTNHNIPPQRAA